MEAPAPTPKHEQSAQELVEVPAEQVRRALESKRATAELINAVAAELQLSAEEVARLRAGAPLAMTAAQYASITVSLTQAFARPATSGKEGGQAEPSADGDFCSCCGSPTPTTATATPTAVPTTATPTAAPTGHVAAITDTHSQLTETDAGTTRVNTTVGSGTAQGRVMLRTGVQGINPTRVGSFAISYQGPDSQNAHWLQFIWREVVGVHSDGSSHPVAGTMHTSGANTYELTANGTVTAPGTPGNANINTDSANAGNPFYEAGFRNTRTADATTIYDQPQPMKAKIDEAVAAGATRVVSRAHFSTFLIQNDRVTFFVETNVVWDLNATAIGALTNDINSNPGTQTGGNSGEAAALPTLFANRLHQQYPAFAFIN